MLLREPFLERRLRRTRRVWQGGVTLFEVLLVVALIALLSATTLYGSGMLGSSRVRASATLILAAVRKAATQANTMGHPVRIVFDFDTRSIGLEEASTSRMLRDKKDPAGGADPVTEAEKEAADEAEKLLDGPRTPKVSFKPVPEFSKDAADPSKGRALDGDVEFASVQTEKDAEPVTSGRAYLYFWPGGVTERGYIQLRRRGQSDGLTVSVSALTGRGKILHGLIELPRPRSDDEEDQGEREAE